MDKKTIKKAINESKNRSKIYAKLITEAEKSFRELNSQNMQGTLIQIEDLLDSNHMYAYKNWKNGIVWDGPNVDRYWVTLVLAYPYDKMPDPKAALRITELGGKVTYRETEHFVQKPVEGPGDLDPQTKKPLEEKSKVWLVTLLIPRRFIENTQQDNKVDSDDQNDQTDDTQQPQLDSESQLQQTSEQLKNSGDTQSQDNGDQGFEL